MEGVLRLPDLFPDDLYVFRGQSDSSWGLKSSFERAAEDIEPERWPILERNMLLEFKRHAHHFVRHVPKDKSLVEWLAIMQHYGCPTRLLDFTRSAYIALFFAVQNASNDSAIWAIDTKSCTTSPHVPLWDEPFSSTYHAGSEDQANKILDQPEDANLELGVVAVEPLRLNERMSIQQSLFLFPKKVKSSFEENLHLPSGITASQESGGSSTSPSVVKIIIPRSLHDPIAYWLEMFNVTSRSLFPGLEGYARSFSTYIRRSRYKNDAMNALIREAVKGLPNSGSAFEGMNQSNLSNAGVIKEGETDMMEELHEAMQLPNGPELAWRYIKSEIEIAGVEVQRISRDGTITTDKEVPEAIKSRLREYAADNGITLKFQVSGQES